MFASRSDQKFFPTLSCSRLPSRRSAFAPVVNHFCTLLGCVVLVDLTSAGMVAPQPPKSGKDRDARKKLPDASPVILCVPPPIIFWSCSATPAARQGDRVCKLAPQRFDHFALQKEEELSEEDKQVQENLELMVERVKDVDVTIQKIATAAIAAEIRCTPTLTCPCPLTAFHHTSYLLPASSTPW